MNNSFRNLNNNSLIKIIGGRRHRHSHAYEFGHYAAQTTKAVGGTSATIAAFAGAATLLSSTNPNE